MADVDRNPTTVHNAPPSIDRDGKEYDPSDINAFNNPAVGANPDGVEYPPVVPVDEADQGDYIELDELDDDQLAAEVDARGIDVDPDAPRDEVVAAIVEDDTPKAE